MALTSSQRAAGRRAQALVLEVVSAVFEVRGDSGTRVTRAIASSPALNAEYRKAVSRHDDLFAAALAVIAAGVIRRFVANETPTLSASVLAVPLVSASQKPDGEWSQAVLSAMKASGAFGGPSANGLLRGVFGLFASE